jgi:hypothetical protein
MMFRLALPLENQSTVTVRKNAEFPPGMPVAVKRNFQVL